MEATFLLETKAIPTAIAQEKVFDGEHVNTIMAEGGGGGGGGGGSTVQ